MSNEPFEKLLHGKALCGKVFKTFVETFNWHTDFCRNLKGDGDIGNGKIKFDRSDARHPVIRFVTGTEEGDGESHLHDKSCFRIEAVTPSEDGSEVGFTIVDNYYMAAGCMMRIEDASVSIALQSEEDDDTSEGTTPIVIYMMIDNHGSGTIETAAYDDDFKESMKDESKYIVPLYLVNAADGNVITDLRSAPNVQIWDQVEEQEVSS